MTNVDLNKAREMIGRCRQLRDSATVEAVLRSEIQSYLRLVFPTPDDEAWVNQYSSGTEAHTKIGTGGGGTAARFIDNLIGATTIEYEADLRVSAKYKTGYGQVQEQVCGLLREGVPVSQVRGILSDTVDWYAFDVVLPMHVAPHHCDVGDITLQPIDELKIASEDETSAERLIAFIRKHLARERSRPLRSDFLTSDLGLNSGPFKRSVAPLIELIAAGRDADSSIKLATDLWSAFVDFLEGETGAFRTEAYADEVYLCILARLLSANALTGEAILSDDDGLKSILDGSFFLDRYQLQNMVELDYFGWLIAPAHIARLVPIAREIQRDLYAYDFSWRPEEDLFGRLMAELARRSERKLLGQEWTPAWLARQLADRCLSNLPQGQNPRIVDMCCGSGAILAEIIKSARDQFGLSEIDTLHEVATGFDIDPLAVSLSKTTWVVALADEIKLAGSPITIPVFHADSLFAVTPVSAALPILGDEDPIPIDLDGVVINLPHALVNPDYRELFDRIVDWAYDEARDARTKGNVVHLAADDARSFLSGAAAASGISISEEFLGELVDPIYLLVRRMADLAVANRNGIWAFILKNTYRPGLLTGQFNGLVSNPPWLALSSLADNPYRSILTGRAALYGIRPAAQSFLHLELGTTHLLHAVDRYLMEGASVACLVPGTIFNGHHHEAFRQRSYLSSKRPVALEVNELWQVERGTFKYPGAAVIGHKRGNVSGLADVAISGFAARPDGLEQADFSRRQIGSERTAWVLEKEGMPIAATGMPDMPQQGADLMPRTAVCIDIIDDSGAEYRVDTPKKGSPFGFTVKAAKELKDARFPGHVHPRFIHRMAQSENLLPFLLADHRAPIAIPAERDSDGVWQVYDETDIRKFGLTQTARRFRQVNEKLAQIGQKKSLQQRIDERRKLIKQALPDDGFLLLTGAGGKIICSACVPADEARELVVDQTLYWKLIPDENEAWFLVGMLNSRALTEAITPFNPKGAFSERHVHTLPYRLMPPFDSDNDDHLRIASVAKQIAGIAKEIVAGDGYLNDPERKLDIRRRKLREALAVNKTVIELEELCAAGLGTTLEET